MSSFHQARESLRGAWSSSRAFRRILVIVLVYTALRLAVQGAVLVEMTSASQSGAGDQFALGDLQVYLDAASRLQARQDLYLKGPVDLLEHYIYSPAYALAFTPFLRLPPAVVAAIDTLLHLIAYSLLYLKWGQIFDRLGLKRAQEMLAWTLPVWLIFSAFWSDLGYLNIYTFMALLATLLIESLLEERLAWSLLWLSLILQVKPHWAFAVAVPLLLGRRRFFLKLLLLAAGTYVAVAGLTLVWVGPVYGWQQYVDYVQFLGSLGAKFPWRGPEAGFLGYNHSITQVVVYLLGATPGVLRLALGIKILLLLPLLAASWPHLVRPAGTAGRAVPQLALNLAFAFYLGAFIWLDVVWEVTLGIVVFNYLLASLPRRRARLLAWAIFLPYALVDFWQVASFIAFGPAVILPGFYIKTDPSIYIPLTMVTILACYGLLLGRLRASGAAAAWTDRVVRVSHEVEL